MNTMVKTFKSFWTNSINNWVYLSHIFLYIFLITFILIYGYNDNTKFKFFSSTIGILLTSYLLYPNSWQNILGLNIKFVHFVYSCILSIIISIAAYFVINWALMGTQVVMKNEDLLSYFLIPFQCLNEEFVFRALLITGLVKIGFKKWPVVIGSALLFSFFHWLFFTINLEPKNRGDLSPIAMMSLFAFGMAMNLVFLKTRNVFLPWAIHLGWNMNRFASRLVSIRPEDPHTLRDLDTFNVLEASFPVLGLSLVVLGMSVLFYNMNTCHRSENWDPG